MFVSAIFILVNKRVPNGDSYEPAFNMFKFLVRNGCVNVRKSKGLNACDMVEIWRLKMFYKFF